MLESEPAHERQIGRKPLTKWFSIKEWMPMAVKPPTNDLAAHLRKAERAEWRLYKAQEAFGKGTATLEHFRELDSALDELVKIRSEDVKSAKK